MKILLISFLLLFVCTSCIFGKTAKPGEEFTLKPRESITIETAGIKITLDEVGREWLANNGGERPYCKISVAQKGNNISATLRFGKPVEVNGYEIRMIKANPFGTGDATFVVDKKSSSTTGANPRKAAAVSFLLRYNLRVEDEAEESSISIPDSFNSPPFVHYQSASKTAELDLTPLKGKTLPFYTFKLKTKTKKDSMLFAHIVINDDKVVGAWLSTNAPVAPGILPVNTNISGLSW